MTLEQTKETFLIWVKSCQTEEQLRLLEAIANEFIVQRFITSSPQEVIHASSDIVVAIYRKKEKMLIEHAT